MRQFRTVLFFALMAFSPYSAFSESLEEVAGNQTKIEIAPMTLNGVSFYENQATAICAAMGYTRVVRYSAAPCQIGEKMGKLIGVSAYRLETEPTWACEERSPKLTSLVCAK